MKFVLMILMGMAFAQPAAAWDANTDIVLAPESIEELQQFMESLSADDKFAGTILVSSDGEPVFRGAYGLASKRFGVPNNLHTKLNLGSMNKMFTSVAIMQLIERGKLRLTDRLSQFADESWLAPEVSSKIEIQHLLTHASGLGSYFNETFFESSKLSFRALNDYKPLIVGSKLEFEPGTSYRYSNTGMFMLGVVIEAASGQDYFRYIQDNIYSPSGMVNSDCYDMDEPVPNLAIGYAQDEERSTGWQNNIYMHVVRGGPAGGCFSTVEDLTKFANALTGHKLLSAKSTELLLSPKSEFHNEPYGYGFRIIGKEGARIVGHGGGFIGISANLDIFIDQGLVAAVLSNYGGAARPVRNKIRELIAPATR